MKLDFFDHLVSSEISIHSRFVFMRLVVFCVVLVFHFCLLALPLPREAFNSSECSGCSML